MSDLLWHNASLVTSPGHSQILLTGLAAVEKNVSPRLRDNSFFISSARLWNSLPSHVIFCANVSTFKNAVKPFL